MEISRRGFIGGTAAFAGTAAAAIDVPAKKKVRPAPKGVAVKNPLPPEPPLYETADGRATPSVMCRRIYLELAGRIPTKEEAMAFAAKPNVKALVDRLLASDSFADYWSMRFCDIMRVKSEFPINLWPNAVYVYHRRIRDFVRRDERWDRFARALVTATGSDFRDAEANFIRATARRTAASLAETLEKCRRLDLAGKSGTADYSGLERLIAEEAH
jgi:hypothetical protein